MLNSNRSDRPYHWYLPKCTIIIGRKFDCSIFKMCARSLQPMRTTKTPKVLLLCITYFLYTFRDIIDSDARFRFWNRNQLRSITDYNQSQDSFSVDYITQSWIAWKHNMCAWWLFILLAFVKWQCLSIDHILPNAAAVRALTNRHTHTQGTKNVGWYILKGAHSPIEHILVPYTNILAC